MKIFKIRVTFANGESAVIEVVSDTEEKALAIAESVETNVIGVEDADDYEEIECSICGEEKRVEIGTWALDAGMCEPCYARNQ